MGRKCTKHNIIKGAKNSDLASFDSSKIFLTGDDFLAIEKKYGRQIGDIVWNLFDLPEKE